MQKIRIKKTNGRWTLGVPKDNISWEDIEAAIMWVDKLNRHSSISMCKLNERRNKHQFAEDKDLSAGY